MGLNKGHGKSRRPVQPHKLNLGKGSLSSSGDHSLFLVCGAQNQWGKKGRDTVIRFPEHCTPEQGGPPPTGQGLTSRTQLPHHARLAQLVTSLGDAGLLPLIPQVLTAHHLGPILPGQLVQRAPCFLTAVH